MTRKLICLLLVFCICLGFCSSCLAGRIEDDPSGTTFAVDNHTDLPDGVYTPDSFAFSGGTGKVKITCPQVEVKDGQSWATLRFSSSSYQYAKTNGRIYYSDVVDGKAEFVIPVVLNQNQRLPALTTKMSDPHEIEYTIFVQLSLGEIDFSDSDILDDAAPKIIGMEPLETVISASNLRVFRYHNGAVVFEIDTLREAEAAVEISEEERTAADDLADLYHKRVLKYLVVPGSMELPAGMEKQYIVLRQPIEGIYAESPEILAILESIGVQADAVGFEQESIPYIGSLDQPNYRAWILNKTGIILADSNAVQLLNGSLADRLAALSIPLVPILFDQGSQQEWQQLYAILFDMEA